MGKLTAIAIAAILACCVALVSMWGQQAVAFVVLAVIILIVFGVFWEIRKTLEKHPELALMDGAEYVAYRRIQNAAKGQPTLLTEAQPMPDPTPPRTNPDEGDD
ncbi:MAG: hypothetical protein LAP39_20155 [Acidobacteriia bacterium]|nr:hypothetical protein [Terriglobia bacterium]